MKYLRHIGLMSSLLIVGILGGLMAPLPSEAAPTLTLQVDSGTPVSILGPGGQACPTGFTSCYAVGGMATGGTPSQSYTVSAAPGLLPRLNLTDIATTDQAKLTGIKIAPGGSFPATETHVLKIVMSNTFSAGPNPAGYYVFAMRTGGYFQAGGSPLDTQYDYVEFAGTGTFCAISTCNPMLVNVPLLNVSPSTVNRTPLSLQVGNSGNTATSFTLNQVTTYPTFNCKNANNQCTPDITLTYTVTLKGSDSLVLSDSNDSIGVSCNLIPPGPPLSTPAIPCHKGGKAQSPSTDIGTQFAQDNVVDNSAAAAVGAVPGTPCTVNCPGVTDIGNPMGTITINKQVQCPLGGCPPATFFFDISGAAPLDNKTVSLTVSEGTSGSLDTRVHSGGPYSVVEQAPPTNWTMVTGTCTNVALPTDGSASCSFTNQYTLPEGSTYHNGYYYIVRPLSDNTSWADARTAAQALGTGWDLATIYSQDEQTFIQSLLPNLDGLTGTHEFWIAGEQPSGSQEPGGNWQWATDHTVFYDNGAIDGFFANWGSGPPPLANEPNDCCSSSGNEENHAALDNRYGWGWNDNDSNLGGVILGYVAKKSAP
jgi:hypothetical protein